MSKLTQLMEAGYAVVLFKQRFGDRERYTLAVLESDDDDLMIALESVYDVTHADSINALIGTERP
jgi:hypothetical protein